jgi:hypothetical protein
MILVAAGFGIYLARVARRDARIRNDYRQSRCTVVGLKTVYAPDAESTTRDPRGTWWTEFTVRYDTASGPVTSVAQLTPITSIAGHPDVPRVAAGVPHEGPVPCWYDPAAPNAVALERPGYLTLVLLLIPLAGMLGGALALRETLRTGG